jgi:glycosyltransferase involved in cell wall biosynthesis
MKYVIVTPVKNEEEFVARTIKSVKNQTIRPEKWVIVDDQSTDNSTKIIKEAITDEDWISLVQHNSLIDNREGGAKVVDIFYTGYEYVKDLDYDFIVKLDADLTLPENYFAKIAQEFKENPKLGMAGGYCVNIDDNGGKTREVAADYHIRGAFKSIRKECWNEIGGFKPVLGWDGLDEMEAMFYGWQTKNLELEVIHHRPTSSAYKNRLKLAYKYGVATYKKGSNLFLILVRALVRLKNKPYIIYSFCYFWGFLSSLIRREPKAVNKELEKFTNEFHYSRFKRKILRKFRSLYKLNNE